MALQKSVTSWITQTTFAFSVLMSVGTTSTSDPPSTFEPRHTRLAVRPPSPHSPRGQIADHQCQSCCCARLAEHLRALPCGYGTFPDLEAQRQQSQTPRDGARTPRNAFDDGGIDEGRFKTWASRGLDPEGWMLIFLFFCLIWIWEYKGWFDAQTPEQPPLSGEWPEWPPVGGSD